MVGTGGTQWGEADLTTIISKPSTHIYICVKPKIHTHKCETRNPNVSPAIFTISKAIIKSQFISVISPSSRTFKISCQNTLFLLMTKAMFGSITDI